MNQENTKNGTVPATGDAMPITISFASEQIVDRYRSHVDHFDLSEKAKAELLLAVWHIMSSFVDRAFGSDPVQLSQKDGDGFVSTDGSQDSTVLKSGDDPARSAATDLTSAFGKKARRRHVKGER